MPRFTLSFPHALRRGAARMCHCARGSRLSYVSAGAALQSRARLGTVPPLLNRRSLTGLRAARFSGFGRPCWRPTGSVTYPRLPVLYFSDYVGPASGVVLVLHLLGITEAVTGLHSSAYCKRNNLASTWLNAPHLVAKGPRDAGKVIAGLDRSSSSSSSRSSSSSSSQQCTTRRPGRYCNLTASAHMHGPNCTRQPKKTQAPLKLWTSVLSFGEFTCGVYQLASIDHFHLN